MYAPSTHNPSNFQKRRTSPDILSAGRQDKSVKPYRSDVRIIHGIPYTQDERFTNKTTAELRETIITLCRDQYLTYDRTIHVFDSAHTQKESSFSLPDFNEIISWYMDHAKEETRKLQAIKNR